MAEKTITLQTLKQLIEESDLTGDEVPSFVTHVNVVLKQLTVGKKELQSLVTREKGDN